MADAPSAESRAPVRRPSPGATSALPAEIEEQIARTGPVDIAIGLLTYNNADTVKAVAETAALGLEHHFPGVRAAFVNADAGSTDGTPELVAAVGLPTVEFKHEAPLAEQLTVPFHGVPGRGPALHQTFTIAHRLGAHALAMVEADVTSLTEQWVERLISPILTDKADFVVPAYARHRYDGTITNLVLRPLVRALYGRRLHQPLAGQQALSARLIEHLLVHPRWNWSGRDLSDLWVLGAAIADGFSVWQTWLGRRTVRSRTRTTDLPTMLAQTLGSVFTLMDHHEDLWLEVRGSEPLPEVGRPVLPTTEPMDVNVTRMIDAFQLGLRDLLQIWELILTPETLGEVLGLEVSEAPFRFPSDLWARVVYDFAIGHHYAVVHREHLLRSLVPLYLGCTAAFVVATRNRGAEASEAIVEDVSAAFERRKSYLVERWR